MYMIANFPVGINTFNPPEIYYCNSAACESMFLWQGPGTGHPTYHWSMVASVPMPEASSFYMLLLSMVSYAYAAWCCRRLG